ncbi:hypothetical protein [Amycolatopsis cihanbeyliensis]|uniref:Uncharacterized protein n=1 Tax=Amycolatopsis cihanbeyliensis TaxID=1128664 RepID=A0A542DF41_AMYCI|nr:hypothetical protein [Amycolatopsis cihanbeyliensis]TQJ01699.1 hypothetical protein FB471_1407 [Amycolatopsis cihanbeyliensis]
MATRLFVTASYVPARHRRGDRSPVGTAVRALLEHAAAGHGVLGTGVAPGRIGLVRGFDHASRAVRDELRAASTSHGWSMLDLPTVPGFGTIPVADDMRLVVVAHRSLVPVAERCAACWDCHLLDPGAVGTATSSYALRDAPALAVTTAGGAGDSIASRFELSGSVTCRSEGLPDVVASAVAVQPNGAGLLLEHLTGGRRGTVRMVDTTLRLDLPEPTRGTLDGHPQLFPAGEYAITTGTRRVRRVVADHGNLT